MTGFYMRATLAFNGLNLFKNGVIYQDLQSSIIKQGLKDVQSVIDLLKNIFIIQLRTQAEKLYPVT